MLKILMLKSERRLLNNNLAVGHGLEGALEVQSVGHSLVFDVAIAPVFLAVFLVEGTTAVVISVPWGEKFLNHLFRTI